MNAAVHALERMRDGDSMTVVSFDTSAQVVVPPTRISGGNRSSIEAAIRSIRLGGDTCISCGLEEGMQQLALTTLGGARAFWLPFRSSHASVVARLPLAVLASTFSELVHFVVAGIGVTIRGSEGLRSRRFWTRGRAPTRKIVDATAPFRGARSSSS
jgi:von Willebrand factor type A domain